MLDARKIIAVVLAGVMMVFAWAIVAADAEDQKVVSPSAPKLALTEKSYGKAIPLDIGMQAPEPPFISLSDDGAHAAYVVQQEGKEAVCVDGKRGSLYDIIYGDIMFSPDGKRLAYTVMSGEKQLVVVDGVEGKKYDTADAIAFSADSKHVAYIASDGAEGFVVLDGAEGKHYAVVQVPELVFCPGLTYIAQVGEKAVIVRDGVESKQYEAIAESSACWNTAAGRYACVARLADGKYVVVDNGVEGKPYDAITSDLDMNPDGTALVYFAMRGDKEVLVVNSKETEAKGEPLLSPDASRTAYVEEAADGASVVLDGAAGKKYKGVESMIFSADSKRFAYIADDGGQRAVVDGNENVAVNGARGLAFSPDSKHVAYIALIGKEGQESVVVDAVIGKTFAGIDYPGEDEDILFTPVTQRVMYIARDMSRQVLVVGDVVGPAYGAIAPESIGFSPDEKHVGYLAHKEGKGWVVVIDGAECGEYTDIVPGARVVFESATKCHVLARKGDEVILAEIEISE